MNQTRCIGLLAALFLAAIAPACNSTYLGGGGGSGGTAANGGSGESGSTTTNPNPDIICPDNAPPKPYGACTGALECTYDGATNQCPGAPDVIARCVDDHWHVYSASTCDAPPANLACDPTGRWTLTTTGPYDPTGTSFDSDTQFWLDVLREPSGYVYVADYKSSLTGDGCQLSLFKQGDEDCFEYDGQSFCTLIETYIDLDFSQNPPTGTVTMDCWGECGAQATAPLQATKNP